VKARPSPQPPYSIEKGRTLARYRPPERKGRTREHVIADLSVNHVERQALLCGYSVERRAHDYGIDLMVYTHDVHGEIEPGELHFQVKATDHLKVVAGGTRVVQRLDRRDVAAWLQQLMPVILVVYDAVGEVAYWLHIQGHFARRPRAAAGSRSATLTVQIPRTNVFQAAAIRQLAQLRDHVLAQAARSIHHE
jgi:hypothetical protein